jgi:3D (Asp-Asp-Asp) domain-containing protein
LKIALLLGLFSIHLMFAGSPGQNRIEGRYVATAYSVTGITASGNWTKRHFVAADPDILPIGSRIKVTRAGRYSGEYVVADTGVKIQGRRLDIYMPNEPECKKFGVKPVRIRVLQLGDGTKQAVKQADKTVKDDVNKDVAHGKVGGAATEVDWNNKGASVAAAAKANAVATPAAGPSKNKPVDATTVSQPH